MKNILFLKTIQNKAWKNRALFLTLALVMSIGNAWGATSHDKHYGKMVLQNATGHGTVYLSTAQGSNSGETSNSNPGTENGTSCITWDCNGESGNDKKTYYARYSEPEDGWYYAGWANTKPTTEYTPATTGKTSEATSTDSNKPTETTIYGFFKPVTVTGAPGDVYIEAKSPTDTYPDADSRVLSFTTTNSNTINDFSIEEEGDERFEISSWTRADASTTTFYYTFVGNNSYGTTNRTFIKTVTLTSKGDASSTKTCILTAKYPNPKVIACDEVATDLEIYPIFKATDDEAANIKESTAVFDVKYADNGNNFTAIFSNTTGGEWTVTGIDVDQKNQKATVTYTFSGKKIIGTHTAQLTLTANDCKGWDDAEAPGGQSVTIALTAHNEQEATDDAKVIAADGETLIYQGDWANAFSKANANTGCTLYVLRDVSGLTSDQTVTNTFTLDLNGKKVTGAKNGSLIHINKAGITLTIKDSKTGGIVQNIYQYAGNVYCINCTAGSLIIEGGTLYTENKGAADRKAFSILQRKGTTITMNGGKLGAAGYSEAYGVYQVYNETNEADNTIFTMNSGVIDVTGYTKTMGIYSAGKININAGTINATATSSGAYGIYMDAFSAATTANCYFGTLTIKGGTINSNCTADANASRPAYGIYFNYATSTHIATATGTIENATINVSTLGQKACGVIAYGSYQSKTGRNNTILIKNTKIEVTSKYSDTNIITEGIRADVDNNAACYAQIELENCDVKVTSTSGTYVYGVYTNAVAKTVNSEEKAVASKVNINGGTYTITAGTSNAYGIYAPNRAVSANTKATAGVEMTIKNIKLDVNTNSDKTAVGIRTAGHSTIDNVNIKATAKTTSSYGIIVCDQDTTTISNTEINASGTGTIYGIYVNATSPNTTNGYEWHGNAILETGNNVTTRATAGNTSYAIYVHSNKAGSYVNAGEVIINDGAYKATASGTTAYAVYSAAKQTQGENVAAPRITINGGKFWAEATSTFNDISSTCAQGYCVIYGGYYLSPNNIDARLGEGAFKFQLKSERPEYTEGYRWHVTKDVTGEDVWQVYDNNNALLYSDDNLTDALDFAKDKTNTKVVPTTNYTLPAGTYTIPSGVTLLIPYNGSYLMHGATMEPTQEESNPTSPTCYRTLTFSKDAKVIVTTGAAIEVGAIVNIANQSTSTIGGPRNHGKIRMNKGSSITLESGSNLYCWGYIVRRGEDNEGEIDVKSGATVYECLQIRDWKGGSVSTNLIGNKQRVFPVNQYYIQNVEVPITFNGGAKNIVASGAVISSCEALCDKVYFVTDDKAGLFCLESSTKLIRDYNEKYDRQEYTLKGNASLNNFSLNFKSEGLLCAMLGAVDIKSEDYLLPFTNNMTLTADSGTISVDANVVFCAGVQLNIEKDATINVNKELYIYDADDWYSYGSTKIFPLLYAQEKVFDSDSYIRKGVEDVFVKVDGTINVNGKIFTTAGGANIYSTDAGKIKFNAPTLNESEKYYESEVFYVSSSNSPYFSDTIEANSAWLHNDTTIKNPTKNPTYTLTSDAVAGDEFWYIKSLGRWVKNEFGPELDIVDADSDSLTINANGWTSSGWPYTINNKSHDKGERATNRTLKIPYSGTSGASLPIAVLDSAGNPICRHIYVPFVYNTSNATMSGTNENSIVFVKSGILQTTDGAKAKEIYVAPGAELKVNGILTVGKLVLRTTPWQSAVLTDSGTINGQVYYSRIVPDSKQYYQFGLPLSCPLADVRMSNTGKLGGSQPKYGTAWMLKSYSENKRANNGISKGANWTLLENTNEKPGTIAAGVGYEMFSNSNYYREFYFPVTLSKTPADTVSVSYTTDGTEGAEHAGWNIITSPYVGTYTNDIKDVATAIKVCWLQADGSYLQEAPTIIPPAVPFAYQAIKKGSLDFSADSLFFKAPRKQSAAEALTETEWVHLDIFDAYGEGDETSLFVHPTRFEQTYKTGIDVAKQSLTAARPIIYSTHAYGDMAFAGVADSLLENGIDLVVYSPAEQKLTFSLRENKFLHRLEYLWLADNETGARTDLLMDDYTCRANAGTIKGRFVLNGRFKAPQISTGIGNTQTDYNIYAIGNNIAISGVEQGTPIYVFDAVGHMIYTTAATSDEVIVPAPCAGVYMLSVGGQTAKLVINK